MTASDLPTSRELHVLLRKIDSLKKEKNVHVHLLRTILEKTNWEISYNENSHGTFIKGSSITKEVYDYMLDEVNTCIKNVEDRNKRNELYK